MKRILVLLPFVLSGCWSNEAVQEQQGVGMITVTSSAFEHGKNIPSPYTCEGENYSPDLAWTGIPAGTKSLALLCDDPDASPNDPADPATVTKTWTHWVVANLPPDLTGLPEKATIARYQGAIVGTNSFGKTNYGGPCPPKGVHRYFFKLYALDIMLSLDQNATGEELAAALQGHIIGQGVLMGHYKKRGQ